MRTRTSAALLLVLMTGAVLWAALLPLAAWAVRGDLAWPWRGSGLLVYRFAAALCHQLPERSFSLGAVQLPVCARCAGLYMGAAAMALMVARHLIATLASGEGRSPSASSRRILPASPIGVLALAAVPTAITLGYEWIVGYDPGNWIRAASGGPLGAAVAAVLADEALLGDMRPRRLG